MADASNGGCEAPGSARVVTRANTLAGAGQSGISTFVDGDRMYASFTHLTGYSSNYYTYVLDKVIAIDFFSQFDKSNLLDGPTAMRYRRAVLEPGATKPATELVKDFLGRPQNLEAVKSWMAEEFRTPGVVAVGVPVQP